jgi:hypothetical protein
MIINEDNNIFENKLNSVFGDLNRSPRRGNNKRGMYKPKELTLGCEVALPQNTSSLNNSKMLLNQSGGYKFGVETAEGTTVKTGLNIRDRLLRSNTSLSTSRLDRKPSDYLDRHHESRLDTCWRKFQAKSVAVLHSTPFSIVTTTIVILELFLDDVRILWIPKGADWYIDFFIFLSAILFCIEIILSCLFVENYLLSFFNFVDVLSTASLIPYFSVFSGAAEAAFTYDDPGSSILSVFITNTHITKTSKASLIGTKFSRLSSLLRVFRVFSLGRIYRHNLNKLLKRNEKIILTQKKKNKIKQLRRKSMNIRNFEEKMKFFQDVHQLIGPTDENIANRSDMPHHLNPVILKNFYEYNKLNETRLKIQSQSNNISNLSPPSSSEDGLGPKIFLSNLVQDKRRFLVRLSKTTNNLDLTKFNNEFNKPQTVVSEVVRDLNDHDAEDEMDMRRGTNVLSTPREKTDLKDTRCNCLREIVIPAKGKKDSVTTTDCASRVRNSIKSPQILRRPSRVADYFFRNCNDCGKIILPGGNNLNESESRSPSDNMKRSSLVVPRKKIQFNEDLNQYKNDSCDDSRYISNINEESKRVSPKSSKFSREISKMLNKIDYGTVEAKKADINELNYFKASDKESSCLLSERSKKSKSMPRPIKTYKTSLKDISKRMIPSPNMTVITEKRTSAFHFLENISPAKKSMISAQTLFKSSTKTFMLNEHIDIEIEPEADKSSPKRNKRKTSKKEVFTLNRSKLNILDNDDTFSLKFFQNNEEETKERPTNQKLATLLSTRVNIRVIFIILILLFVSPMLDNENYMHPESVYQYEINRLANLMCTGQYDSFFEQLDIMLHDETFIEDNHFEVIEFGFADYRLRSQFGLTGAFDNDIIFRDDEAYSHTRTDDRIYVDNAYFYLIYNYHDHNQFHATLNLVKIFFIGLNLWWFSFSFMFDINKSVVVPLEEIFNTMRNKVIRTESLYYDMDKAFEKEINQLNYYEEIFNLEKFFRKTSCIIIRSLGIRFYNFFIPRILAKVDHLSKKGMSTQMKGYLMVIKLRNFESLITQKEGKFVTLYSKIIAIIDLCIFEHFGEIIKIDNDTIIIFFDINFLETEKEESEGVEKQYLSLVSLLQNRENLNKFLANFSLLAAIHIQSRLKYFNDSEGEDVELNISLHKGKLNQFIINTLEKVDICIHSNYLKKCLQINVTHY